MNEFPSSWADDALRLLAEAEAWVRRVGFPTSGEDDAAGASVPEATAVQHAEPGPEATPVPDSEPEPLYEPQMTADAARSVWREATDEIPLTTDAAECEWCPLCRLLRAARTARPDLVDQFAAVVRHLVRDGHGL